MRFALCNEMFQDMPWPEALRLTAECGYTGWEIAPFTLGDRPTALSAAERSQLAAQIRQAGVEVLGLHWLLAKTSGYHLTTEDAATRQRTASYLAELARLCRDLGGGLMVLGSPQQRNFDPRQMTHAQATQHAVQLLEQLVPALEATQVTLALEPLGQEKAISGIMRRGRRGDRTGWFALGAVASGCQGHEYRRPADCRRDSGQCQWLAPLSCQ